MFRTAGFLFLFEARIATASFCIESFKVFYSDQRVMRIFVPCNEMFRKTVIPKNIKLKCTSSIVCWSLVVHSVLGES